MSTGEWRDLPRLANLPPLDGFNETHRPRERQNAVATKRPSVGTLGFLRTPETTGGYTNPPTMMAPTVGAAASPGDTSLHIACASAFGYLAAGDTLQVGQEVLTVASNTNSLSLTGNSIGFGAVPIVGVLANSHSVGDPILVTYAADVPVYAVVNNYPRRLIDGTLIQVQDLLVTIGVFDANGNLLADPFPFTMIGVNGDLRSIVNVTPNRIGPTIISYSLQAR